tara:strand:+ start:4474 stop:4989 length:516 start_codon:yes stop_codon:yes gene_type:complete
MSKSLIEIDGFKDLEKQLKRLTNDQVKKREVRQILGAVANTTVKAVKGLVPLNKGLSVRGKNYSRKKRQVRNVIVQESYSTGWGKESIGKKMLTRAKNPMLVVRARNITLGSKKDYGGWYIRQMLIRGTKYMDANPIMDKGLAKTNRKVNADSEARVAKYIQKKINKLSNV